MKKSQTTKGQFGEQAFGKDPAKKDDVSMLQQSKMNGRTRRGHEEEDEEMGLEQVFAPKRTDSSAHHHQAQQQEQLKKGVEKQEVNRIFPASRVPMYCVEEDAAAAVSHQETAEESPSVEESDTQEPAIQGAYRVVEGRYMPVSRAAPHCLEEGAAEVVSNQDTAESVSPAAQTADAISNQDITESAPPAEDTVVSNQDIAESAPSAIQDAYLVERRRNTTAAQLLPDTQVKQAAASSNNAGRTKCLLVGGLLAMVGLVAALVVWGLLLPKQTPQQQQQTNPENGVSQAPTGHPTAAPSKKLVPTSVPSVSPTASPAPTSERFALLLEEILVQFTSSTLEDDLANPKSPQYKAALWMVEQDVSNLTLSLEFPIVNINNTNDILVVQFRQRYALAVFYYATNGDYWLDQCNFLDVSKHVCDWNCPWPVEGNAALASFIEAGFTSRDTMGISCLEPHRLVFILEMILNNVTGTLPHEMQGMDLLGSLILPENQIQGTIPFLAFNNTFLNQEYGRNILGNVILYANRFSGSLPDNLGTLTNLNILWVQDNLLTGTIPSSLNPNTTPSFTFLEARNNLLQGTIPDTLLNFPSLTHISLQGNLMTGTIPNDTTWPLLNQLILQDNAFSGTIPESLGLSAPILQNLDLAKNSLTGTILPTSLKEMTRLELLSLYNNQLTGTALYWSVLESMTNLQSISLGNNHISGTIPSEISQLTWLELLDLGHSAGVETRRRISGSIPTEIGLLTRLRVLSVSRNDMTGTLPTELGNLESLSIFIANTNAFTGMIPTELNRLRDLAIMSIHLTNLTGSLNLLCAVGNTEGFKGVYKADCLGDDEVICDCCIECCDKSGHCEEILF